jgi:aerobic carbon-monoxide dehydrogenase medium subunit
MLSSSENGEDALKAPKLGYVRARALDEVFVALAAEGDEAKLLAGGQSLVPALNMRLLEPRLLIDINFLPGLGAIAEHGGGLRIGALARHAEIGRSPLVARLAPLIHHAIPHIAHPAIRNRGTFGGSLAHADPAAELPACAVALDAVIQVASARGARSIAARAFFKGIYETALAPDEIIIAIGIPKAAPGTRAAFLELARRRGDYAMVGLAATARMEGGTLQAARLVFFGVDAKPIEASTAAAALGDGAPSDRIAAAQDALGEDLDPSGDLQADRAAKLHLARVLLARGVRALAGGVA